jgi:hypothetical protein
MEELLEEVFSVGFVPNIKDKLTLQESPDTAVRRVGDWCEMAASLRDSSVGIRVYSQPRERERERERESAGRQLRHAEVGNCGRNSTGTQRKGNIAVGSCYQATASEGCD